MVFYVVILILLLAVLVWTARLFKRIVKLRQRVEEAWSGIDLQLRRRYDLLPRLKAVVAEQAEIEESILDTIRDLHDEGQETTDLIRIRAIEDSITATLSQVFEKVSTDASLYSSDAFRTLLKELVEVEQHLHRACAYYNEKATRFNRAISTFPGNIVTRLIDMDRYILFNLNESYPTCYNETL